MRFSYDLTLGLPHTNHRFFAEHLLLAYAGHFQWQSIAAAAGRPLSSLRTVTGSEVYASFYYIEIIIPDAKPLESFRLDDVVRFEIALRAFKNLAFEGRVRFDRPDRLQDDSPSIRFANIFITPEHGNRQLRVAAPQDADFAHLPALPNEESAYHLTRSASESGSLGLLDEAWREVASYDHRYDLDADRDTNGAGLVYFANYVAFMNIAERRAMPGERERSLRRRRIAYYANAEPDDVLSIAVTTLRNAAHPDRVGLRYVIRRQGDGQVLCLSEAIKVFD